MPIQVGSSDQLNQPAIKQIGELLELEKRYAK